MLIHPRFNPVFFSMGPLKAHWYGVMYLCAFSVAWLLGRYRAIYSSEWSKQNVSDLIFYSILGVIIGGRIGYMLFYSLPALTSNPFNLFKIWQGGMSFHGGLVGVMVSMFWFAKRFNKTFFEVSDFTAPLVPLGIAAGRLGNFINAELWGKATSMPWGMVFPDVDLQPRHPSQLYELLFEGLILFGIVWFFSAKPKPKMAVSGLFAVCYGFFRFTLEFYRMPDSQYGYLAWNWLTMGQVLTIPIIILGFFLIWRAYFAPSVTFKVKHETVS